MHKYFVTNKSYCLDPASLSISVPRIRFFDIPPSVAKAMQYQHRVSIFPIHKQLLDVGHFETLERAPGVWV